MDDDAAAAPRPPLFTPLFFTMCGFTCTVFLSAFLLLPTAPLRILSLHGSSVAAGAFLGLLTYASAFTAPLTGALADRFGRRRTLVVCSLVLAAFVGGYAVAPSPAVVLALALAQGVFWSGLLSASAAYITGVIPESRRAEGIGYWGLSTMVGVLVAPTVGLWIHERFGWAWLCALAAALDLLMAAIAWRLVEQPRSLSSERFFTRRLLEWRVLLVSLTLFLYSFGYGGITSFSALYAQRSGVRPAALYLAALSLVVLLTRPLCVPLAERLGHRRVLLPCLALMPIGLGVLALGATRLTMVVSALLFGIGFGTAYPVFAAYVTRGVAPLRRGAAFGAILAAFDTGIGTGSICAGWLIGRSGFRAAFAAAAGLSALALPYFLFADGRLLRQRESSQSQAAPRTPLESPWTGGSTSVSTRSENT
jgi:MFS family permease